MPKNNKDLINPEDIKAWEDFKGKKFLEGDKGEVFKKPIKENKKQDQIDFKIDLHGYSLQESFVKIRSVIENCYQKDLRKILIITGKGLRSKVKENPYLSEDLSLLKYAIPNFLKISPLSPSKNFLPLKSSQALISSGFIRSLLFFGMHVLCNFS